jgi:hypothetical protein
MVTDGELSWLPVYLTNVLGVDFGTEEENVRSLPA